MNGPFLGQESGEVIARFVKDELFEELVKIRDLAIEASDYKSGFFESFLMMDLRQLENKFVKSTSNFLKLYKKWNTPDILYQNLKINPDDPQKMGPAMQDYFNSQQAVMQHFNEGFRLIEYINSLILPIKTTSYNRISILVSLIAIVVSVFISVSFKR